MLNVGTQRAILLGRIRDPLGNANSEELIWDLFNRLQWAVNAQIEDVVGNAPLALLPQQCVYPINANLAQCQKVLGVRDGTKDLYPMEFDQLNGLDRSWFRRFRDSLRWFALCGYDLLFVGPPPETLQSQTEVTVFYKALTTPIVSDSSEFELQDENVQSVMELAEAILLAKARDWAAAKEAVQRAVKSLGLEAVALRDMMPDVEPDTKVEE